MRCSLLFACLAAGVALATPACAQSPFDGPLASPDAPVAKQAAAPTKHAKAKSKKPRHVATKPVDASPAGPMDAAGRPSYGTPTATSAPGTDAPSDPLSLGMKWQGNNDSALQTRTQNLDGSAFGSGAEVGMKLHF